MAQPSNSKPANPQDNDKSVNRRDFVKTTVGASLGTAAVSAGLFPNWSAVAGVANVGGTDEIKVGLIGCGGRGTGAALQALHADPGVRLVALADTFGDHLQTALTRLQNQAGNRVTVTPETSFLGFNAFQQLINTDVDVVLLATPPVFRPAHLAAAVQAGKHVFCEKPMAVDAPGVRSIRASTRIAHEKNISIVSGYCWRYSTHLRATFEQIHHGALGKIHTVQANYNTGPLGDVPRKPEWSDLEWQLRNWKAFAYLSGDHIVEQAIHAIDWINWAFGTPPTRAYAVGGRAARSGEWTGNLFDHFGVTYEYENGGRGFHMARQIANCSNDNTAYLLGEKGNCFINPWTPTCRIEGEKPWRWQGRKNDMYQQEQDELFASIRQGKPLNDGEWMAQTTLMGILGREAAYTGKTISWEEILNSEKSSTPKNWDWTAAPFPPVPVPGVTKFY